VSALKTVHCDSCETISLYEAPVTFYQIQKMAHYTKLRIH